MEEIKSDRKKDIGGVKLEFSIEFNENDQRKYIEKVSEIQDRVTDVINELKHNFVFGTGEAILKSEIK